MGSILQEFETRQQVGGRQGRRGVREAGGVWCWGAGLPSAEGYEDWAGGALDLSRSREGGTETLALYSSGGGWPGIADLPQLLCLALKPGWWPPRPCWQGH